MSNIINRLDSIRHVRKGAEYWTARELQRVFKYSEWRDFALAIKRAQKSCNSGGKRISNHFVEFHKMVLIGSNSERRIKDYALSRYACYLIAMNGDPAKPEIAEAQTYFAVETRKSEFNEQIKKAEERISARERLADNNRKLSQSAISLGVTDLGRFHNAGISGLYGGLNAAQIKEIKGIPKSGSILDRAGRAELAANDFRVTQAELRIVDEQAEGNEAASRTHNKVGKEVRESMRKIGRTLPENLSVEPPIENLKLTVRKYKNRIEG